MNESIRIVEADGQVVLLCNGTLVTSMPPEVARQVSRALAGSAARVENDADPERTIMDQAILRRAGIPIGLSDDKRIQARSHTEAQHNRDLRRYMSGVRGIPSQGVVGTPTITGGA